jgi:DNA-binding FrmR family transcriptional regulator
MTRMRTEIKTSCLKRLKRIEGQIRGLAGMVEEDRYCIDVVTQIAAAKAALRRVEEEILRDHVAHCVEHAISSGDKADQRRKIAELMAFPWLIFGVRNPSKSSEAPPATLKFSTYRCALTKSGGNQ